MNVPPFLRESRRGVVVAYLPLTSEFRFQSLESESHVSSVLGPVFYYPSGYIPSIVFP